MLDLITSLLGPFLGEHVLSIVAGVGAVIGGFLMRWSGAKSERNKQKVKDHERAAEIRDRVRDAPDDSLRKYDGSGWRD